MLVIPAIQLRSEGFRSPPEIQTAGQAETPVEAARRWVRAGFRRLHVLDVDAAAGLKGNRALVEDIARDAGNEVLASGGVHSAEQVQELFEAGAWRVVVESRALDDVNWLADMADTYPALIVVAADARERQRPAHGWRRSISLDLVAIARDLSGLPLGGLLVSATQGAQLSGVDLALLEDVAEAADFPVLACDGVASMSDLRALEHRGIAAVVLRTALADGTLDPRAVVEEFPE
jgi:phosphoribosylformimino-5-aminoimidazole carboxamide ribotide isomerase